MVFQNIYIVVSEIIFKTNTVIQESHTEMKGQNKEIERKQDVMKVRYFYSLHAVQVVKKYKQYHVLI